MGRKGSVMVLDTWMSVNTLVYLHDIVNPDGGGFAIEHLGTRDLYQPARVHDRNAIGQGHGCPQVHIQARQRLVQQHQ